MDDGCWMIDDDDELKFKMLNFVSKTKQILREKYQSDFFFKAVLLIKILFHILIIPFFSS